MRWQIFDAEGDRPLDNDPVLAMVRQIGYEFLESVRPVLRRLP
jgi:hypothetical protein